ncbi:TetR/AcrR family transcriptional regulator [Sulfitobacter sp. 20_GPM-1509m]|jgi:AcrR family transcriptional regulator|uniref:TetR/AcrR family transcriptional regulator n=1 Tax=Sulfitobacter sp. 20_GPM-1509m TaxID=1380367 RepID=UPI000687BEEF|nr:TetR/AcrR family transcriptional regulator [Sulfitobacter sp. 20_GPM-1509m]|tara:strand:- start:14923 stop:15600 length:678 start_codon:yes stop_codon:yes gene_type:complete
MPKDAEPGLRDRKKARRREDIIAATIKLFEEKGVDATTIADIAEACEVSAPTVFNYFGSKDGILLAIIEEGTQRKRESGSRRPRLDGVPLASIVLDLFSEVSQETLDIASRRLWRYAEASVIRRPDTDLSKRFRNTSRLLIDAIVERLEIYELRTRVGTPMDIRYLATLLHDLWMPCYLTLITDPQTTLADHDAMLSQRITPFLNHVFDDSTLAATHLRRAGESA